MSSSISYFTLLQTLVEDSQWTRTIDLKARALYFCTFSTASHSAPASSISSLYKRKNNRRWRFCPFRLFSIHFYYYLFCFGNFFSSSLWLDRVFFFVIYFIHRSRLFVVVWFTFCLKGISNVNELNRIGIREENGKCTTVTSNLSHFMICNKTLAEK